MNSLKVSNLQEGKLIEMCKILFPEYKDWGYSDILPGYLTYYKIDSLEDEIEIHWFEFCSLHLATKLYNLNNRSEISTIELYRGNIIQNYHPVDYLYQEYLFYKK